MIFVFGDSHAIKYWRAYAIDWIAGLTCFGFCDGELPDGTGSETNNQGIYARRDEGKRIFAEYCKLFIPEDLIVFSLGETDCRMQVYFHHKRDGTPIEDLLIEMVNRYIDFLKTIKWDKAVLDVIPAIDQDNVYNFLFYANRETRAQIKWAFNNMLSERCNELGIPFISTWHILADDNGFLKDEYATLDKSHANDLIVPVVDEQLRKFYPEKF